VIRSIEVSVGDKLLDMDDASMRHFSELP